VHSPLTVVIDGQDLSLGAPTAVAIAKGGPPHQRPQPQRPSPNTLTLIAFHPEHTQVEQTGMHACEAHCPAPDAKQVNAQGKMRAPSPRFSQQIQSRKGQRKG